MAADARPYLGSNQPGIGPGASLGCCSVTRKSKKDRPPAVIRGILAQNLAALRDRTYARLRTPTARNRQLAIDSHIALSQVQRILARELGTSVDYLELLAVPLGVRPQDLITPYYFAAQGPGLAEVPDTPEFHRRAS
jgi:hypothetical protein